MTYLLATNNPSKAKEIAPLFEEAGLTLISLADLGFSFEANEDGETFLENATQKAKETAAFLHVHCHANSIAMHSPIAVIADDSGLIVDALSGILGVHSALFMGYDTPYAVRCQSIIDRLAHHTGNERSARFMCTLVCIFPNGLILTSTGTIEGCIAHKMHGDDGFGYDPIFYYPPLKKTLAQLSKSQKNEISHRGKAIQEMIGLIKNANIGNE